MSGPDSGLRELGLERGENRDFDVPRGTPTTQGLSLWCFNIVGAPRF